MLGNEEETAGDKGEKYHPTKTKNKRFMLAKKLRETKIANYLAQKELPRKPLGGLLSLPETNKKKNRWELWTWGKCVKIKLQIFFTHNFRISIPGGNQEGKVAGFEGFLVQVRIVPDEELHDGFMLKFTGYVEGSFPSMSYRIHWTLVVQQKLNADHMAKFGSIVNWGIVIIVQTVRIIANFAGSC